MKVVHSPLHARHDGGKELHRGELVPCFEMPSRADFILQALRREGFAVGGPREFPLESLLRVHDAGFVEFLRTAHAEWRAVGKEGFMLPSGFPARSLRRDHIPAGINGKMGYYAFDASTPIVEGTWDAALAAAHCALTAAAHVVEGERGAYALCRPPGHHAGHAVYGGYCFLNNAALAAQYLRDHGKKRVAVLDVDYHHGNGTQDIFWERSDVLFVSIHGTPETEYPYFLGYADERGAGEGEGYTRNFPLPRGTAWAEYVTALDAALDTVGGFAPDALVVSLGVDTYEGDPISAFKLETRHYPLMGERLARLGIPTVFVQEGGYAVEDLGSNVAGVLKGFLARG
ncbi:histone deacetylase family protein [Pyxidicoccus fallax]|uniref:Histone deacetylase family protein n=1 Tax=Pyxidicoccus fallax TaxID=394095 RepID=A0A848LAU9_9BACT|nr:histone deacetylase family protein [Pyxidicoccus fallax]NMO15634.1 histone deacetylase family protein [Pyxidicoccus fallax]NPC77231.1 histone deacetylase family protein [Pyxidicoccus fallax]